MKVSFDFDDTLTQTRPDDDAVLVEIGVNEPIIDLLRAHAAAGDEVLIVTSRSLWWEGARPERSDVHPFIQTHNLPVTQVIFTNGKAKAPFLVDLGVEKHFDDDVEELARLPETIEKVQVPLHPSWDSIKTVPE